MNDNKKCIACGKSREKQESQILVNGKPKMTPMPLIKHHVSYDPELVAHVHYQCHIDIHAGKYPHLIQYQEGDAREFYDKKQNITI